MKIGDLALASDTGIETIRFYEREALLPAPGRTQGNFRVYEQAHLERLRFIRRCRSLDMSLDDVRVLLRFKDEPGAACQDVDALIDRQIVHVTSRLRELQALEQELLALRASCCETSRADQCGILSGLSGGH
jgi:Cd(II)/Pb(II)-responsive transcriptional regulator